MKLSPEQIDALVAQETAAKAELDEVRARYKATTLSIRKQLASHLKALRKEHRVSIQTIGAVIGEGRGRVMGYEEPNEVRSCSVEAQLEMVEKYTNALNLLAQTGGLSRSNGSGRRQLTDEEYLKKYSVAAALLRKGAKNTEVISLSGITYGPLQRLKRIISKNGSLEE